MMTKSNAPRSIHMGLVGDYDASVPAHRAIPIALARAASELGVRLEHRWLDTDSITSAARLAGCDAIWVIPNSPYRSMDGALLAIRHARERRIPFLGTCGGFQHAVIEYLRNMIGISDADHAETSPTAAHAVITALECALFLSDSRVHLRADSQLARAYGAAESLEEYQCRYGFNPHYREQLEHGSLRVAATDDAGDVRGVELDGHPFFVATLFQPERAALAGKTPPLVRAFVSAAAAQAARESVAAACDSDRRTPLTAIDFKAKLARISEPWAPRVVAELNEMQFKLVKLEGEFVWHKHDETEEAFLVLEGEMEVAFRDRTVRLSKGQLCVVPRGVEHITRAANECHALIIEPRDVLNTGDAKDRRPAPMDVWI